MIKSLICNFRLDYAPIEQQWDLLFADYFAEDLKLLAPLAKDGLVDVDEKGIQVTAKGRLLIRNICMIAMEIPNVIYLLIGIYLYWRASKF